MKQNFIFLILMYTFFIHLHCKENVDKDQSYLSEKRIIGTSWYQDPLSKLGFYLSFQKGNQYSLDFAGEGCGQSWIGEYTLLSPTQIQLKKGIQQMKGCDSDREETICNYEKDPNPIYSEYFLNCENSNKYWSPLAVIPLNSEFNFEGEQVIGLAGKLGVTTDDAKLRAKPDVNSKSFTCDIGIAGIPDPKPFVKNNTNLVLLFKTKDKQKVKNWESNWYYVSVETGWYGGCDSPKNLGWIFGEFVKESN